MKCKKHWVLFVLFIYLGWPGESSAQKEAVILHWNDFHSANLSFQPSYGRGDVWVGGSATLAGYLDSLRRIHPQAISLNAGDDFQGSPLSSLTRGWSQIIILNQLRPTAFTIGNHEFDYGVDNLKKCLSQANFEIVSCNLYDSSRQALLAKPYILKRAGELTIAIIGVAGDDMKSSCLPENVRGIGVLPSLTHLRKYIREVNPQADLIVILSHSGFDEDSLLALQLSEADVIIGGHSHSVLRQPKVVNNILICQAGANGRSLGYLKAQVDSPLKKINSFEYQLLETSVNKIRPNTRVRQIVDSLEATIAPTMNRVIGQLISDWTRNSDGESNIGNWICDATRSYFNADLAFMNSGGIRKGLKAGPIRVRDIWEISPFDNTIDLITLSGAQLWQMLEYRLRNPRDFLQVSGIQYAYQKNPLQLREVTVLGEPLNPEKSYILATNNFVVGQFERFFGFNLTEVRIKSTGIVGRDILIAAVEKEKTINSQIENRIRVLTEK